MLVAAADLSFHSTCGVLAVRDLFRAKQPVKMGSAGMPYGLQAMLKDGYTHVSGMSEAVFRNLEACKELSKVTRTSMGPNGAASTMLPCAPVDGPIDAKNVIIWSL